MDKTQCGSASRISPMQEMFSRGRRRTYAGLAVLGAVSSLTALGATATGAGAASVKATKLTAAAPGGTLTQWNWETEADDPGGHALMPLAIKLFQKAYPK